MACEPARLLQRGALTVQHQSPAGARFSTLPLAVRLHELAELGCALGLEADNAAVLQHRAYQQPRAVLMRSVAVRAREAARVRTWLFTLMLTCSMLPTSGLVSSVSPMLAT